MKVFGKRLGYRVSGGVATILVGVLAAAGAQQQRGGPDMASPPELEAPQWADPMPIASPPADSPGKGPSNWAAAAPAAFATADPASQPTSDPAGETGESESTDSAGKAPSLGPSMILPVGYQTNEADYVDTQNDTQDGGPSAGNSPEPPSYDAEVVASSGPPAAFSFPGGPSQQEPGNALRGNAADENAVADNAPGSNTESFNESYSGTDVAESTDPTLPGASMPGASMPASATASLAMPAPAENRSPSADGPQTDFASAGPAMAMPAMPMSGGPMQEMPSEPPADQQAAADRHAAADRRMASEQRTGQPSPYPPVDTSAGTAGYPAYESLPSLPPSGDYSNTEPSGRRSPYQDSTGYGTGDSARGVAMNDVAAPAGPGGRYNQPNYPIQPGQPNQAMPGSGYAPQGNAGVPSRLASHADGYDAAGPATAQSARAFASPGDRRLEGAQTPSIAIHKTAPAEVKVGQPATFVIHVQNVGTTEAMNVQVHDRVPAGMRMVDSAPAPDGRGDTLVWSIGAMPPGDQRTITMQLVPTEEGELGSVARVTFEAAASVRTRSTRPELKIVQQVREDVLIGQQLEIDLEVSNVGTGAATGVVLQVDVPEGLEHPRGRQLDNALGSLRPGETRREVLRLRAVAPGVVENTVRLIAEDAEPAQHTARFEVTSPQLNVALNGPSRRFLERQATYNIQLENRGTAAATNVELIAYLDRGLTFVSTENEGQYDPNRHAVLWSLPSLPAGEAGSVPVTLLPVKEGEQAIRLEAIADLGAQAQRENTVAVESQAELSFSIADTADPIELGTETTYEVRVQNSGSRNDTGVQVALQLPPGMELLQSDADAQTDGRGRVVFAPAPQLAAGDELVYRVRVRGVQPDTHVIDAVVTSDQSRVPVKKQESTMVYADR